MGLQSNTTIALAVLLTVAMPVTTLIVWNRLGGNRPVRLVASALLLITCQGLAIVLAGLLLNKRYDFYTSWSEVFGKTSLRTAAAPVGAHSVDSRYEPVLRAAYRAGHGTVVPWVIPGTASGIRPKPALLYLPAEYGDPAASRVRYPVVELLDGFPANPGSWTGALQVQSTLDRMIGSGQSLPFVAVMPTTNVAIPRDTQCVNAVRGPQVETYLTRDVRAAVAAAVRVQTDARGWGLMGYSSGGYCALNLAMRHPDLFSATVSLSGYAFPAQDPTTGAGRLFYHDRALIEQNSPLWEAQHWNRHKALNVLAITSRQDWYSYRDTVWLAAAAKAHPSLRLSDLLLSHGGHNAKLWVNVEPVGFNWLSRELRPPLAGIIVRGDLLPTPKPPVTGPGRHPTPHSVATPSHQSGTRSPAPPQSASPAQTAGA